MLDNLARLSGQRALNVDDQRCESMLRLLCSLQSNI
jgi:hypothetical protein